jgi:hypothetical protein
MPLDDAIKMMFALFALFAAYASRASNYKFQRRQRMNPRHFKNECKKPLEYKELLQKSKGFIVIIQ